MQSERVVLTYQDYLETPDDGNRYEIHEGELSVNPAPGRRHQGVSANFFMALRAHVTQCGLGELYYAPLAVILDDTTIVEPDLVFVETARLGILTDRGVEGPPTLVVEIISPYSRRIDRVRKLQLYARYEVPYYWIVDPAQRTIEGCRLVGGRYEQVGRAAGVESIALPRFPDLRLNLRSLWV